VCVYVCVAHTAGGEAREAREVVRKAEGNRAQVRDILFLHICINRYAYVYIYIPRAHPSVFNTGARANNTLHELHI